MMLLLPAAVQVATLVASHLSAFSFHGSMLPCACMYNER